jgi:hypothetical protein
MYMLHIRTVYIRMYVYALWQRKKKEKEKTE